MDLLSFIQTANPTKVRIGERQRSEEEPKILETTIGRVVLLISVAPARSSGKLEASVDKLFDEGGSGEQAEQGHSASGGQGAGVQPISEAEEVVAQDVVSLEDQGTLSGASIGGKSRSTVQRLLAGAALNVEVKGGPIPTLPFVTSSAEVDSFSRPSALVITPATAVSLNVNPATVTKEKIIKPSLLSVGFASAGGTDPAMGCFADFFGNDFLVVGIRTVISPDTDLQKECIPQWSVGAARQMSLSAKVSMRAEYNIKKKRRLASVVEEKNQLLKSIYEEIKNLKAHMLLKEAEATNSIHLCTEVYMFKAVKRSLQASVKVREQEVADLDAVVTFIKSWNDNLVKQLEKFQDEQMKVLNEKFDKLYINFIEMALYLEESGNCKATEKGMRDGLAARITHGKEGRVLVDVAAYNPFTEVNYVFALQELQRVNFSLLAELKLNNDSRVETLMNILCLEETLPERLGLNESQPHVDQLRVPIHYSPDQTVVGATAL
nr:hypothetical protein [Tanacetum cinerariifolium]